MGTDFQGVAVTEAGLYLRLNLVKVGPGRFFTQLGWGISSYQEDENQRQSMSLDYSLGYRFFFLGGFYAEPYFRTGFPLRLGIGLAAGHWFDF
jgi:hypothetical protein